MTYTAIQFRLPSWWPAQQPSRIVQVVEQAPPPQPDYGAQIAELRADLARTREDLAQANAYITMLQNITGRQDNELVSISTALTAAQAELQLARQDKQHQARQIKVLQEEIIELRNALANAKEETAQGIQIRQALQLANDELKREIAALRASRQTEGERGE